MSAPRTQIHIAGLTIPLHGVNAALHSLHGLYAEFDERCDDYRANPRSPHLCAAGCSHCCRKGAFFAVTLIEAVEWSRAVAALPNERRDEVRRAAVNLLAAQHRVFLQVDGPPDEPGRRDEPLFSSRVSAMNASESPACPLLDGDLCGVYGERPMLCRAYGFPVDAYAVRGGGAIVFRSLCVLYEGMQLVDYVRAEDLKSRLAKLSRQLTGGHEVGRFTSAEAILASVE